MATGFRNLVVLSGAMLLASATAGCGGGQAPTLEPTDASPVVSDNHAAESTAGLRFIEPPARNRPRFVYHNDEEAGHASILESLGGGVALADYERDGLLDLFFPGGGRYGDRQTIGGLPPALFRNRGSWQFDEITTAAGCTAAPYYSHAAAAADFDNDGFLDVLVTGYGGLVLFHNEGDGTFRDTTAQANLQDRLWSSSAGWADVNGDGLLDLYVVHYVDWSFKNDPVCPGPRPRSREVCPPHLFHPLPDALYLNRGDGGFVDASREAGLVPQGKGLGVVMGDVDLDGDVDIYVGNDGDANLLYRNDGRGRFQEVGLSSGVALNENGAADGSMGVDLGDFNLDGLPDLWAANFERESFALYRNRGAGIFQHVSRRTGITAVGGLYVGWGTAFFDADRDGDEDIFASNGHVVRFPANAPVLQCPLFFENLDGQKFRNVAPQVGPYWREPHAGRGAAVGDIDNDGDLDLVFSPLNEQIVLLSNESENHNHWFGLRLLGVDSNRDAVGAVVRIQTVGGSQMRQCKGGGGYASTNDSRLFFGLGRFDKIDRCEIRWPSGTRVVLENLAADQVHTFIETAAP